MEKRSNTSRRRRPAKKNSQPTRYRALKIIGIVIVVMFLGVGCGFLTASMNTKDLTSDIQPPASSQIYDVNGNEIANVHAAENRRPVKLDQVPKNLQNAFIAVEDNRFYEHSGIDPRGILRALYANIRGHGVSEGGSTITQQLAKNAYLTQDRTLTRKIQEAFLALKLEHQYTKDEILEMYLNQIYFGDGAYGVEAAAKTYFGKDVQDLDLNECAMLAGIPKSPNYYSPSNNMAAAQDRKATVLDQMVKYGYIDAGTAANTKAQKLNIVKTDDKKAEETKPASYFVDYVTQVMVDKYGADAVYQQGLKIYTSIDMDLQKAAEDAVKKLPVNSTTSKGVQEPQAALVSIDPHTGYIKAMVGGRGNDQFNRATMAVRQPGSTFKPFVFAAALENKYTPDTVISDSPITLGDWSPQNDDNRFRGDVTLRDVARLSLNVPTIKIAQKLGIDKPIYYAQEMGISTFVLDGPQNDRQLATAIGGMTKGVTPLEITSAYGTFANKGVHVEPTAIVKVVDRNGKIIEEHSPKERNVISEDSAYSLTKMLESVVTSGTGKQANIGRPVAGKTGTTSDYKDAWFIGYTPDLVTGVWVGNDDNTSMGEVYGGTLAAPIWKAFMEVAVKDTPIKDFDGKEVSPEDAKATLDDGDDSSSSSSSKSSGSSSSSKSESKSSSSSSSDKSGDNKQSSSGSSSSQSSGSSSSSQDNGGGSSAPAAPAPTPAPAPAAPSSGGGVPEPGEGVSKGR